MFSTKPSGRKSPSKKKTSIEDKKMTLQNRITVKINGCLSDVREGRSKGKSLDSPEVCEPLRELANEIGFIMAQELKLSEKFELGDKLCTDVLKEETLVDDMIDFCLQNINKLSPISSEEEVTWTFFMNGTIFSSDLSRKLSKSKLLEYGKDILEATHDSYMYVNGKSTVSDYCRIYAAQFDKF